MADYQFDVSNGNFETRTLETGKEWFNYLWNAKGYVCSVTHTGLIHSRYIDGNAENTRLDQEKQNCLYLRDDDDFEIWNPGGAPTCRPIENYRCVHGQEFTEISSEYREIAASLTVAVFPDDISEVWRVRVGNRSDRVRRISVVPLIEFDLDGYTPHGHYFARTTAYSSVLPEINSVLCHSDHPHKPHPFVDGYISSSEPAASFEGRLERFFGTAGNLSHPLELERNELLSGDVSAVRPKCGVIQNRIVLNPGEEKTIYYRIGFTSDAETLKKAYAENRKECAARFEGIVEEGKKRFGKLRVKTPDARIDRMMNFWLEKQVDYCMIGKKAVRDNAQIALAMLNYDTELSKRTLTECIAHQYRSGQAVLNWVPFIHPKVFSDPSMWMMMAVCEYVMESGDTAFLDTEVPYLDGGSDTVYAHTVAAAKWYMLPENLGVNGLPKIHYADWNDALNIPDENAESVFMAMGLCWVFRDYAELCRQRGDDENAAEALAFRERIAALTNEKAWNGHHYLRAFSKFGTVGDQPPVYINPQSWAILAGIVPANRLATLIRSIDEYETPEGIRLCSPAYEKYDDSVGRMSGMLPGVYENGGIYNHACGFKVMADCKLGRGNEALRSLLAMMPDTGEQNRTDITTTEPYVMTNCYLLHPCDEMKVGFSWQTGSSAWGLRCFYEGILGLNRTYGGLRVCPALPDAWDTVEVERRFRGSTLFFRYHNKKGKQVRLAVDGKEIEGDLIRPFGDGKDHLIDVYLG